MKYVCIVSTSGIGGIWSVVRYSLPLFKNYYDVSLVLYTKKNDLQDNVINYLESIKIRYLIINIDVNNGWIFDICKVIKIQRVREFIGKGPVIVHCQDSFLSGAVLPFLKSKEYYLFCTIHGAMFETKSFGEKVRNWINKNIRCRLIENSGVTIISCDPNSIPTIQSYFTNTDAIELAVNGVPEVKESFKEKPKEPFVVGFMSRFHPLKRWDLVAESVNTLNKNGYNVKVVFAGAGDDSNKVKQWCELHSDFAIYLGNIDNISVRVLPEIHVHALPTQYPEGLPMIILESMAAGIPSITTNAGSCAFAIQDGVNGFIIEPRQESLINCLKQLIENQDLYYEMSVNSRKIWEEQFSDKAMIKQYISIFSKVING